MKRMTLEQFGQVVSQVMERLPAEYQQYLDNVVVDVEEEPDPKTLRKMGVTDEEIAAGESMYGLFDPLDLPGNWSGDVVDAKDVLHRLVIYKRPLEEDFPNRRRLMIEIRKTVIHELAHHFGYTDRDLEKHDANPDPYNRPRKPRGLHMTRFALPLISTVSLLFGLIALFQTDWSFKDQAAWVAAFWFLVAVAAFGLGGLIHAVGELQDTVEDMLHGIELSIDSLREEEDDEDAEEEPEAPRKPAQPDSEARKSGKKEPS